MSIDTSDAPLILLADDEPLVLELLQHRLEMEGYRVITAVNGQGALDVAIARRPDVIVLDTLMPIFDGLEVLRRLKLHTALAHIPVLVLSGIRTEMHAVAALKLGAMDFLHKPFLPDELVVRLKRLTQMAVVAQ
jgi:DNA-binding response OmpR family regulator